MSEQSIRERKRVGEGESAAGSGGGGGGGSSAVLSPDYHHHQCKWPSEKE